MCERMHVQMHILLWPAHHMQFVAAEKFSKSKYNRKRTEYTHTQALADDDEGRKEN